jgi:cell wall-associated NlpC family hydrolase
LRVFLFIALLLLVACAPLRPLSSKNSGTSRSPETSRSSQSQQNSQSSQSQQSQQDIQRITGIAEWDRILSPWLGTPYKYGGNTKDGVDCSGFVSNIYMEKERMHIPRTTKDEFQIGKSIDNANLIVGDLVFFGKKGNTKNVSHVGIYVGNGKFIHASTSEGVTVTSLDNSYWKPLYLGARRYL